MDDIARDVVQRQAQRQAPAHNEYVVAWGATRARPGGFNWTELELGVRAQILRHVERRRRVDCRLSGREPWPASYDTEGHTSFDRDLHTIQTLSFVQDESLTERDLRRMQAWPAALLNVTFSTSLDRWWSDDDVWDPEDDIWPDHDTWMPTAAMEDALYAQMQRTYSWTGVRAIRLIRHDGEERDDYDEDEFTFQIVRSGEHGDEVIEAPESFRLSRPQRDELATLLTTRLGMQHRVMRELGIEHRLRHWMGRAPGRRATWAEIETAREEERHWAGFDEEEVLGVMHDVAGHLEPEEHARRTRNRAARERARERNRRPLQHFDEDWVEHPNGEEWSVRN
jgi:hypothetical protein